MGVGFDTYQVFRDRGGFPRWLVFFCDVLFWLASVAAVFYVLVWINDGIIRFPIFLGIFAGAWIYFVLGSKKYIHLLLVMIKFCKWMYRVILMTFDMLLIRPIRFIFKCIWVLIAFLLSVLLSICRVIWKVVKFLLSPFTFVYLNMTKRIRVIFGGNWLRLRNKIGSLFKRK